MTSDDEERLWKTICSSDEYNLFEFRTPILKGYLGDLAVKGKPDLKVALTFWDMASWQWRQELCNLLWNAYLESQSDLTLQQKVALLAACIAAWEGKLDFRDIKDLEGILHDESHDAAERPATESVADAAERHARELAATLFHLAEDAAAEPSFDSLSDDV